MLTLLFVVSCKSAPTAPTASSVDDTSTMLTITLQPSTTEWLDSESRWTVPVTVRFSNESSEPFALDKVTACPNGSIMNDVFVIEQDGAEIQYQGVMAKRAHPGRRGFHNISPGGEHSVSVDLGEAYAFPAEGGTFSVAFDHFNHFSVNAIQLTSAPIELTLSR